ncbi:MAG: hypothetical protein OXI79_08945 [Gammaproteobacteria bacterium]|nr:hypothetical protein [Gammaproteobacteria bacterium]
MRQLFNRTLVLFPLLALLAAPAQGFGQSGRSWSERFDTIPASRMPDGNPAWWNTIDPMAAWVLQDWANKAVATSKWHTNDDCQDAMEYTRAALDSADIQAGLGTGSLAGEYFGDEDVIVVSLWLAQGGVGFGTVIHEAWHRSTGDTDADITALNTKLDSLYNGRSLESCHDEAREEDEDDDPNGGEDPGTTETCEDVEHPALTTTVPVWVVPDTCGDNQAEADSCDFETKICTGMRLHICPGKWVDQVVVLREAYKERVCTSN